MYNDEFELTFDLADAGPKKEQRRPTLPEPEEAAAAAPPVQETRETPVGAAPENTPAPEREPGSAAEPRSTAPAAKGRTVLISGGDRGIGAAAARAFYAAGCRVAVFYHTNAEAAAALQKELPAYWPSSVTWPAGPAVSWPSAPPSRRWAGWMCW